MYAVPHISSEKGDNKGSCRDYAVYLLKYNNTFFNHSSSSISLEEAVACIDDNSKKRLLKTDAKWFAPVYALSESESQHICQILFDKTVLNYIDLDEKEKSIYNEYVILLAKNFQNEMALNFNKSDLGISSGENLFYIGVVENKRNFNFQDESVKWNFNGRNDSKDGFNTHIHIIQGRLANNGKYSKISPMSKNRNSMNNNLGGKVGFDRINFAQRVESSFDLFTGYIRNLKDTLLYKNKKKNADVSEALLLKNKDDETILKELKEEFILYRNKPKSSSKFIPKKISDDVISMTDQKQYFSYLMKIGLLTFEYSKGKDDYYKNLKGELISVSDKGWVNYATKNGGQIMKALNVFQKLSWLEGINFLLDFNKYDYNEPIKERKSYELLSENHKKRPYLFVNYSELGISNLFTHKYLSAIRYDMGDKQYMSLGIKNLSGGYYSYNSKFNNYSKIGPGNISIIEGKELKENVVIFQNYMDYLIYLQLYKLKGLKESVIILNDYENLDKMKEYLKSKNFSSVYNLADENTVEFLYRNQIRHTDFRDKFGIVSKNSFRDLLAIENLKKDINKGLGRKTT